MLDPTEAWGERLRDATAYRQAVEAWEKKIGALIEFRAPEASPPAKGGALAGLPFAVKDNIAVKGWKLSCGSKMLSDIVSPYTATAVAKLEAAGAVVVAKANLDEFGMGSSTENSAIQATHNPWDPARVPGGSSGGSAAAVASGEVAFALGTDTGGSVRQPAAFCGVYGLKPTYGSVSRFGLTAYASSLETIGVAAKTVALTEAVFAAMRGKDPNDQTSLEHRPSPKRELKTVALLKDLRGLSAGVESVYRETVGKLAKDGFKVVEVDLPALEYASPAYYTIATAEASANLARFNGIRYGLRPYYAENPDDLVYEARTEGFGNEVKLRVMLGTFVLRSGFQEQYYMRAQKIRTAIRAELEEVFGKADILLSPVFPTQAFLHGDSSMDAFAQRAADKFTVTANLAGIPALSFPAGMADGLPVGLQVSAPAFEEGRLFDFCSRFEKAFPSPDCPGYMGPDSSGRGRKA
jgi:aspartyl-tRNA(Asn)/glutamyl-tRNA(Gln) amidotransferase subunit A